MGSGRFARNGERNASLVALLVLIIAVPCSIGQAQTQTVPLPIDAEATVETRQLFANLQRIRGEKILFGHHETSRFMVTAPSGGESRWSDVKAATGQWPGLWGVQMNFAIKWNDAAGMRQEIRYAREIGAAVMMTWHMDNPVTGGNNGDLDIDIASILPGGANHHLLVDKLSEGADYLETLTDSEGRPIPILFRPWHEHNLNSSFWWNVATPEQLAEMWRFEVEYLRGTRGLHHLLYVYTPNFRSSMAGENPLPVYFEGYPGDDYVDVLGLDYYGDLHRDGLTNTLRAVVQYADENGKVPALSETGLIHGGLPNSSADPNWFRTDLLELLKSDPKTRTLAFTMTWYNKPDHYWVPYGPETTGYQAFVDYSEDSWTAFSDDLPALGLYEATPATSVASWMVY